MSGPAPTACHAALEAEQLSCCASFCPDSAAVAQTRSISELLSGADLYTLRNTMLLIKLC